MGISTVAFSQLDQRNPSVRFPIADQMQESVVDQYKVPLVKEESSLMLQQPQPLQTHLLQKAFFCRIEDQIADKSGVNFKFRLGSVQYVDALEGKGYFEAVSHSQTTNFQMSRKQ